MNILFVSTENPYPPDHGHHIRTYNVLKGLARRHKIFFVGFAKTQKEIDDARFIEPLCETVHMFRIATGWRLGWELFRNLFSPRPFVAQRYIKEETRHVIRKMQHDHTIDLVHCDLLHVAPYAAEVPGVPCVLVNHNVESLRLLRRMRTERNLLRRAFFYIQYWKLRRFEKDICRHFDCCVVVSEADRAALADLSGCANLAVIPNGVDVDFFCRNGAEPTEKSVLWVGSMQSPYNADAVDFFLEEILPRVRQQEPGVKMQFVGAGPTRLLRKKAAEDRHVEILGYVGDVRPYMQAASVFVAPLRSGSGTKVKVLNALAMKLPVVTTPVGAEGIDVVDGESVFIADDPQAFADRTVQLLRDKALAQRLGEAGRRVVEKHYDWQAIHRKTDQLYEHLVRKGQEKRSKREAAPLISDTQGDESKC